MLKKSDLVGVNRWYDLNGLLSEKPFQAFDLSTKVDLGGRNGSPFLLKLSTQQADPC